MWRLCLRSDTVDQSDKNCGSTLNSHYRPSQDHTAALLRDDILINSRGKIIHNRRRWPEIHQCVLQIGVGGFIGAVVVCGFVGAVGVVGYRVTYQSSDDRTRKKTSHRDGCHFEMMSSTRKQILVNFRGKIIHNRRSWPELHQCVLQTAVVANELNGSLNVNQHGTGTQLQLYKHWLQREKATSIDNTLYTRWYTSRPNTTRIGDHLKLHEDISNDLIYTRSIVAIPIPFR